MFRLRALPALALIFALTGCMKVDARIAINEDDTVTGSIVMAVDKRLAPLTGKTEEQLVATITVDPDTIAKGTVVQPYQDDTFVGRRFNFTNVPISEFHGTDQVSVVLARQGRTYLLDGAADLRTVNLTDPAVQRFAGLFAFTISVTFPGKVTESNGELAGNTVTWSPKAGQSMPLHARAEKSTVAWQPWALGLGAFVVVVAMVIAVIVFSRRPRQPEPEPALVRTRHDML
jgi:hypothetical protein